MRHPLPNFVCKGRHTSSVVLVLVLLVHMNNLTHCIAVGRPMRWDDWRCFFNLLISVMLWESSDVISDIICWCCAECQGVFGLITKKPDDKEEKLFVFALDDTSTSKTEFLTSLSKTVCSSQCRTDYVSMFCLIFSLTVFFAYSLVVPSAKWRLLRYLLSVKLL